MMETIREKVVNLLQKEKKEHILNIIDYLKFYTNEDIDIIKLHLSDMLHDGTINIDKRIVTLEETLEENPKQDYCCVKDFQELEIGDVVNLSHFHVFKVLFEDVTSLYGIVIEKKQMNEKILFTLKCENKNFYSEYVTMELLEAPYRKIRVFGREDIK